MIIKPNDFLIEGNDIIAANKIRISNIKKNIIQEKFDLNLENDIEDIQYSLENDVFYEKICEEHTCQLKDTYAALDVEKKEEYYNSLKNSYFIRGTNGFRYTCVPIIKRYKLA